MESNEKCVEELNERIVESEKALATDNLYYLTEQSVKNQISMMKIMMEFLCGE